MLKSDMSELIIIFGLLEIEIPTKVYEDICNNGITKKECV